jgi:hypothetical protein
MGSSSMKSVFEECLACNQQMFIAGRYDTAYDYLLAAYELGRSNHQQLAQVEQLASQECQWLEHHSPSAARFSTQSRRHRQLLSSFRSIWHLAKTASVSVKTSA